MQEVDKWMGQFNTTTQSLNKWLSNNFDMRLKNYIKNLFVILIGNLKLQIALDQRVILQDNHLIDSGLIRALFKYTHDPELNRMLRELKDLMFSFSDHFIYVHDNRVQGEKPEALVMERFNLTANPTYIHSASFGDENWTSIRCASELVKSFNEYKHIFRFIADFVDRMPNENVIANPQRDGIYLELLKTEYDNNKQKYHDYLSTQIRICLEKFSSDNKSLSRSELYLHFNDTLSANQATVAKRLIADSVHSYMVPASMESNNYSVDITELATIFSPSDLDKVYKKEYILTNKKNSNPLTDLTSADCLGNKQEAYLLIASLTVDEIRSFRSNIRSKKIYRRDEGELTKKFLFDLFRVRIKRRSNDIDKFKTILASINVLPQEHISMVVPVQLIEKLSFLYTTHFNKGWRDLATKVDLAMSGK